MSLLSGISDYFGLDIGVNAIRIVQLSNTPQNKRLLRFALLPIDPKLSTSDAKSDQLQLAEKIKEAIAAAQITTRNVAASLPSQFVFTTVVDIERLPPDELAKTIRYQADALIPTPLETSKIDWAVIGDSPTDPAKLEVLLSSVTNEYSEHRLDLLESIGLNVISFEPESLALTRSMLTADMSQPCMIIDIDNRKTDIVIAIGGIPRLTRSIPNGTDAIIRSAVQNLNIEEKQAQEFVFKFGLSQQKLEGQVYSAIIGTIDQLIGDVEKSIKFFASRYNNTKINRIIMTGGASSLPEFPLYMANKFGINVEIGNAWRNVEYSPERQNELMALSNHFAVAVGLAERNE